MSKGNRINDNRFEDMILIISMSIYAIFGKYFMPFALVLFPAPFVILGIKNGIKRNIMNMIVTCIIIGIAEQLEYSVALLITFLPITLLLFYLIKEKKNNMEILGASTVVIFISILIILGLSNIIGIDFVGELENDIHQMFQNQLESIEEMDSTTYELLKEQDLLEEDYKQALVIIPSVLLLLSLVVSYLNYLLISFGLEKMEINIINAPKFSRFRLPSNIMLGVITMFLGVIVIEKMNIGYSEVIIINLVTLIGIMFSIQGLSVIDYFLARFNIFGVIRFITYIMLLSNGTMVLLLMMIGFIDTIFNLRKINIKS